MAIRLAGCIPRSARDAQSVLRLTLVVPLKEMICFIVWLSPPASMLALVVIENEVGNDAAVASLGVEGPPDPPASRPFLGHQRSFDH